ncbi:Icc-related predicted phosphoesterase [Roseimicrobium gellanilyticum]|uniref:Icc-related predicted phosphoesterase n=1 Tax=Roseimicrobium gellanilyticum TaxID=748857 RepID=A0A366H120_9BACT|nr:metallophosphatase domain-containing protein [Roseimicrobium gellanilyticum]RBP35197.1 Icc-related predicted phosphoesterase [Roseimicrobium gellanilyticum]
MPSLCIISDTHKKHRQVTIPPCDILIHAGDFCSFQHGDSETLEDVDIWFAESPAKQVVCIGGNHDFMLQSREFRFAQAILLEDSVVELEGLSIYGSPWVPELPGFAYYADPEMLMEKWKAIPTGIDILVTHTPPHGILDVPSSGQIHLGCTHLSDELKRIQPRLHVFGHVHAAHGTHDDGITRSINASIVGGADFEVCHRPTMISLTAK